MDEHQYWMQQAIALATKALHSQEVPVGAIVVSENAIIGRGWNRSIELNDPTAHAEVMALREAGKRLNNYRIPACDLYVTLEPCVMCAGALIQARVRRVVIGARDPKSGAAGSIANILETPLLNHQCEVIHNILPDQCGRLLSEFFKLRRSV